jgi:drug/metabolite transporter (DMT)-like permease
MEKQSHPADGAHSHDNMSVIMRIPKSLQADLALLLVTLIWGSSFVVVKKSLEQSSPVLFIALRFWIASAAIVICLPGAFLRMSQQTLRRGLVLAAFLSAGFVLQTLGLRATTPSHSAFITSLFVLLVPFLGFVLFRHRPRTQTLFGVVLATVGLALLTLAPGEFAISRGDFLTVLCAAAFALQILFLARYLPDTDYRQLVLIQVIATAVYCTLSIPLMETPFLAWDPALLFYLLLTGILSTAMAFYIQNSAQRFTTANRAALVFSMEPFFAALFSYLILGQVLTGREWAGGILVLLGILVSEIRREA